MKPAPFDYVRPASVAEACAFLAADEDARIIAGGQTLVPMLAMRLSRPSKLVDILRIPELSGISDEGPAVVIGATTRQVDVERSRTVAERLPLLAAAIRWVGHPPTRNRGTVGGSIANADPSAEIPLVAVTLGAELLVRTADEPSTLDARDFFLGPMITAIPPGGCITAVRFPVWQGRIGAAFHEVSARRSDFAFVAAAAQVELDADGVCRRCAVGVGGAADAPVSLDAASERLIGTALGETEIVDALRSATAELDAVSDLHASAAYRKRTAATLARRALLQARDAALGARP